MSLSVCREGKRRRSPTDLDARLGNLARMLDDAALGRVLAQIRAGVEPSVWDEVTAWIQDLAGLAAAAPRS